MTYLLLGKDQEDIIVNPTSAQAALITTSKYWQVRNTNKFKNKMNLLYASNETIDLKLVKFSTLLLFLNCY